MLSRLPRLALIRLMSLLLLATIGLQASEPVRGLHKERGSAFSSATADVAVVAKGRLASARLIIASRPAVMPEVPAGTSANRPRVVGPIAVPDSTGPSPFALVARETSPRAPPLA